MVDHGAVRMSARRWLPGARGTKLGRQRQASGVNDGTEAGAQSAREVKTPLSVLGQTSLASPHRLGQMSDVHGERVRLVPMLSEICEPRIAPSGPLRVFVRLPQNVLWRRCLRCGRAFEMRGSETAFIFWYE